mgnify:CR=1 FL=1
MLKIKNSYNVIGVMSGTSLDGVDLCFSNFSYENQDWKFKILVSDTVPYDKSWITKLTNAHSLSEIELKELDLEFTLHLSKIILSFIHKNQISNIDFISSHGHTVFHEPKKQITYQIGNRVELNNLTNLPVVCDFRIQDVKYGGQGAPLVPVGDLLLFNSYSHCINLGGFSNISIKNNSHIIAYDICAVNVVLNHYSRKMGLEYDSDGELSKSGTINKDLLFRLNSIPYYNQTYPKSLGIEWVENNLYPIINSFKISIPDILCTYIEHISLQISKNINDSNATFLFTGGGVKNKFLILKLKEKLKIHFELQSEEIIDFKEALIFGFLGVLKIRNENNCLKSVTGAEKDHSSGVIFQ